MFVENRVDSFLVRIRQAMYIFKERVSKNSLSQGIVNSTAWGKSDLAGKHAYTYKFIKLYTSHTVFNVTLDKFSFWSFILPQLYYYLLLYYLIHTMMKCM